MNEATQQAINLGANVLIFVIALTISLNLMFAVRDLAEVAKEVNDSVPDGSKIETIKDYEESIIDGYEVVGYYMNYIRTFDGTNYNHPNVQIEIDKDGNGSVDYKRPSDINLKTIAGNIDLKSKYRINIKNYDERTNTTKVFIQKVI